MSWAEIKKAVNNDISLPLNKAIGEMYDEDGDRCYPEYLLEDDNTKHVLSPTNTDGYSDNVTFVFEDDVYYPHGSTLYKWDGKSKEWKTYIDPQTGSSVVSIYNTPSVIDNEVHFVNSNNHYHYDLKNGGGTQRFPTSIGSGQNGIYLFTINSKYYVLTYTSGWSFYIYEWNKDNDTYSLAYTFPSSFSGTKMLNTKHSFCTWNNKLYMFYTGDGHSDAYSSEPFEFWVWDGSSLQSFTKTGISTPPSSAPNVSIVYNNTLHLFVRTSSSPWGKHYYFNGSTWNTISGETFPFKISNYGGVQAFVYHDNLYLMNVAGASQTDVASEYMFKKWDNPKWVEPIQYKRVYQKSLYTKNALYLESTDTIKSVQRGKSSASTVTINTVDPSKCIVIIDPATNGSTAVAVSHTLTENTLTLSGLSAVGWQVIEFN